MNDKPHVFLRMVARTKDSQKYIYSLKVNDALHSNKVSNTYLYNIQTIVHV